jgi:hypothetical protein
MKRLLLACSVGCSLVFLSVGCEETNPDKINSQEIKGFKPDGAPAQQGKNAGTQKEKPAGMPEGGFQKGEGAAKKKAGAFPAQSGPIRPDQIPSDYPREANQEVRLKDGTITKTTEQEPPSKDGDTAKPAPDGDAAKPEGDEAKSAKLSDEDKAQIAKLGEADQKLALTQMVCLISGEPLGSMGVPIRVEHEKQVGFLCCKGCRAEFDANPTKALEKVAAK